MHADFGGLRHGVGEALFLLDRSGQAAALRWVSGLGVTTGKAALEALRLEDPGDGWLLLPEEREDFEEFEAPSEPHYALIAGLDSLILLRRDAASMIEPGGGLSDFAAGRQPLAGSALGSPDLECNAIVDRGRISGLWEYDRDTESIACVIAKPADQLLIAAIKRTERFIREDLGDSRATSLDSPKARAPRIEALRKLVGQ